MNTLKDIYKNIDLYGSPVFIKALKSEYKTVCTTEKSIPSPGSPCSPASSIREDLIVRRAIFHRGNEVTVFFHVPNSKIGECEAVARFF